MRVSLGDVVLVVDFADPADAGGHDQVGRDGVGVVQQEDAAQGRLKLLAVERVGRDDQRSVVEAVSGIAVAPLGSSAGSASASESDRRRIPRRAGYLGLTKGAKFLLSINPPMPVPWTVRIGNELEQRAEFVLIRFGQITLSLPLYWNCCRPVVGIDRWEFSSRWRQSQSR